MNLSPILVDDHDTPQSRLITTSSDETIESTISPKDAQSPLSLQSTISTITPKSNVTHDHLVLTPPPIRENVVMSGTLSSRGKLRTKPKWANNRLHQTVASIAWKHGFDPQTIVNLCSNITAADFSLGLRSDDRRFRRIPKGILNDVAAHYNLSIQKPYNKLPAKVQRHIFKVFTMGIYGEIYSFKLTIRFITESVHFIYHSVCHSISLHFVHGFSS